MEMVVCILPSWFANKTCCSRVLLLLECNTSGLFRGQVTDDVHLMISCTISHNTKIL